MSCGTPPADPVQSRGAARYDTLVKVCQRFGVLTPEDEFPVWQGVGGPVTVAPLFVGYDYSFTAAGDPELNPADDGRAATARAGRGRGRDQALR